MRQGSGYISDTKLGTADIYDLTELLKAEDIEIDNSVLFTDEAELTPES